MKEMSIREVAQQADLETSAPRYYESISIVLSTNRVGYQQRYIREALERYILLRGMSLTCM